MKEPLIIHHVGCADGICGALVLWLGLGRKGELLPAQYGDAPPLDRWVEGREVWIVDFSYPREVLEHLHSLASSLRVLDHHSTAAENCDGLEYCTFDEARSGAKLAYDEMLGSGRLQDERPALVDRLGVLVNYVQDRDLWVWELGGSKAISAWLASYPRTLPAWLRILAQVMEHGFSVGLVEGGAILRNNDLLVEAMAFQTEEVEWVPEEGPRRQALLVNAPVLHSEVAAKLLETRKCDLVCCWRRIRGKYVYNLRSTTVDVSEIAALYGGSGHARAAGFASSSRPAWFFVMPEKED